MQFVLALSILKLSWVQTIFNAIGKIFVSILDFTARLCYFKVLEWFLHRYMRLGAYLDSLHKRQVKQLDLTKSSSMDFKQ